MPENTKRGDIAVCNFCFHLEICITSHYYETAMSFLKFVKCRVVGFCFMNVIIVVLVVKSGLLISRVQMVRKPGRYTSKSSYAASPIYEADWILHFPHLFKAAKKVYRTGRSDLTCSKTTNLELVDAVEYTKGDTLRAVITARDELGKRKSYGGDFFVVTLRRPPSTCDGVTCVVDDKGDGTYLVECILPWSGKAALNALLIHPSESVFQIMKKFSTEKHVGLIIYTRMLNSANITEDSVCTVGFPDKR